MSRPTAKPVTEFQKWFYKKTCESFMTYKDIADKLGVTRQAVSRYYIHENVLTNMHIIALCYIFNCMDEVDYVMSIIERN